jgi:hypothetical protein
MNFIKMVLAVLVAQFLLAATMIFGLMMFSALLSGDDSVHVADGSWLVLDVYGEIPSYDPPESRAPPVTARAQTRTPQLTKKDKAPPHPRGEGGQIKINKTKNPGRAAH